MSPDLNLIEVLKVLGPLGGAFLGGVGAFLLKESLDRRRSRRRVFQTRWLPLFTSADLLRNRLSKLTSKYRDAPPDRRWKDYTWFDVSTRENLPLPSEARDFHELYLINNDPPLLKNFWNLNEPGFRRKDMPAAVQGVRERIHELNFATISLYRMAVYLGHAQRVLQELQTGVLNLRKTRQKRLTQLLLDVRTKLNGSDGAGIIDDLQDLIGASVSSDDGSVINYYEFRERLLTEKGWEQFTDLFRFFAHFHLKIDTEIKQTGDALDLLCDALERFVEVRRVARHGLVTPWTRPRNRRTGQRLARVLSAFRFRFGFVSSATRAPGPK